MKHDAAHPGVPRSYKVALVALTELSSLMYAGTVFGWAPILLVLRSEGLFSNRCGPEDGDWCAGQKEALGMIFTMAAVVYSACGVGVGWYVRFAPGGSVET
jgi:hypothetical protein